MSAYVLVEIHVRDAVRYEDYKRMAEKSVAKFGGRYVVRGGKKEPLEGEWEPRRMVLLEFPNMERAKEWWSSEEYREAKALRHATSDSRMLLLDGM